jgi:adenosylhomocysteine nucleosidase
MDTRGEGVLILCALAFEARGMRPLVSSLAVPATVAVTGVGPDRAQRAARRLLKTVRPQLCVGFGLCGSLVADWTDVVAPVDVADEDGALWPCAPLAGVVQRGRMVSVRRLATTPQRKRELARTYAADFVDQESAAWARVAAECGVAFSVLRAVLDGPEDYLLSWRPQAWTALPGLPRRAWRARQALMNVGGRVLCELS